jgi:hypothetical protein
MNKPTTDATDQVLNRSTLLAQAAPLLAVFAAAIVLMLVAELPLATWAEASEVHHALQHVLIFVAGIAAGGSGLSLFRLRK